MGKLWPAGLAGCPDHIWRLARGCCQWVAVSTASSGTGLAPTGLRPDMQEYQKVAELGLFTPTSLPGVKRVSAKDVVELLGQGAVVPAF